MKSGNRIQLIEDFRFNSEVLYFAWRKEKSARAKNQRNIERSHADANYEIGDEILHPKRGFGIVEDAIPHDYWTQKIYVRFEDRSDGVFDAKDICKIVDGVAIPYKTKRR